MTKIYFAIGLLLFLSCSSESDDANDLIIGKWQIIKTYQSGSLVDPHECLDYIYSEFKTNYEFVGGFLDYNSAPNECNENINFELLKWKKVGKILMK